MKYKVGDIITVKVSVVNIDKDDGSLECCHVGCETDYQTDDTDTMFFDEKDIVEQ